MKKQPISAKREVEDNQNNAVNVAALDIGSNSFHLVVARIIGDSVQVLHRVKQKVCMAEGLDEHNELSEESIVRGLNALENIKDNIAGFHPDKIRIVATYTLRRAKNANDFIHRALKIFPYPVEVISGFEEARLIYSGIAHTHQDENKRLVIDIGGGSTEFIIGEEFSAHILRSMPMGCVSFNKKFFNDGYVTQQRFRRAIMQARHTLEPIVQLYKIVGWENCIGSSGTIKSILSVCKAMSGQESKSRFTLEELESIKNKCCELEHVDTLNLDGLADDRKSVFCAGLSVLIAIFYTLEIESMEVSNSGLREGVLYEMEERLKNSDIRQRTVESIASRYHVDVDHANRVQLTAMHLYEQCADDWKIKNTEFKQLLNWAALLHEVGLNINSKHFNKHSGYIIGHVDMPGFNEEQQRFLAELIRNQRKKIDRKSGVFEQFKRKQFHRILLILRLAVMFNVNRQDNPFDHIKISVDGQYVQLQFKQSWLENQTIFQMGLMNEVDLLESVEFMVEFSGG